jgi:hypothetical protein
VVRQNEEVPPVEERVTDETKAAEHRDATATAGAPEEPTPEEEAAAESYGDASESTKENYEEYVDKAANAKGEGRIP